MLNYLELNHKYLNQKNRNFQFGLFHEIELIKSSVEIMRKIVLKKHVIDLLEVRAAKCCIN